MKARVYVTLKPSVFDPQGRVVADALVTLGYPEVQDVRQGKFFEVDLGATDEASANLSAGLSAEALRAQVEAQRVKVAARVTEMADKLLANPVIESYRVEVLP